MIWQNLSNQALTTSQRVPIKRSVLVVDKYLEDELSILIVATAYRQLRKPAETGSSNNRSASILDVLLFLKKQTAME
jgi:hypothetical protein